MSDIDNLIPVPPQPEISEGNKVFHQKAYALYKWMRERLAPAIVEVSNLIRNSVTGAFNSTSTTLMEISEGEKLLEVDSGRSYAPGTSLRVALKSDPTIYLDGIAKTYNPVTGDLLFIGTTPQGAGTYSDWSVTLSASGANVASLVSNIFSGQQFVPYDAYDETTWNGNNSVPTKRAIRDKVQSILLSFVSDHKNLVVTNDVSAPNSQMNIKADEIILKNGAGAAILLRNVNVTVDITSSGVNGIDADAEEISTNYYFYLMYNPTTATLAGTVSKSATAPTLQPGYTYSSRVSWAYNDAAGNFNKVFWLGNKLFTTSIILTSTLPTTGYVAVSTVGVLPPQIKLSRTNLLAYNSSGSTSSIFLSPLASDDFAYTAKHQSGSGSASGSQHNITSLSITANTLYYKRTGDALSLFEIRCTGGEW